MSNGSSDVRAKKALLVSLFEKAEKAVKKIERSEEELIFPTINQLRYVGYHLSHYLSDENNEEAFDKAVNHCKRAVYDAYETGIFYFLSEINTFRKQYNKVSITSVLPEWINVLSEIEKVKDFIVSRNDDNKPDSHDECEKIFENLNSFVIKLNPAREELNKKIREDRRQSYTIWISVVLLIFAIFAFLGIKDINSVKAGAQKTTTENPAQN